jgi:hypothetical protein
VTQAPAQRRHDPPVRPDEVAREPARRLELLLLRAPVDREVREFLDLPPDRRGVELAGVRVDELLVGDVEAAFVALVVGVDGVDAAHDRVERARVVDRRRGGAADEAGGRLADELRQLPGLAALGEAPGAAAAACSAGAARTGREQAVEEPVAEHPLDHRLLMTVQDRLARRQHRRHVSGPTMPGIPIQPPPYFVTGADCVVTGRSPFGGFFDSGSPPRKALEMPSDLSSCSMSLRICASPVFVLISPLRIARRIAVTAAWKLSWIAF